MIPNSAEQGAGSVRWRYLLLAALILIVTAAILAGLWQVPRLFPQLVEPLTPVASPTATLVPATATPAVLRPATTEMSAVADDAAETITFHLEAQVPPDRQIAEAILWYDTEAGHRLQHSSGPLSDSVAITYQLDAAHEGLTTTLSSPGLDYWWWVCDTTGESVRAGGTVALGPALQTLVVTPTLEPPPIDFAWTVSTTQHFEFHYLPDSAAERDLVQIGALAEEALARTSSVLQVEFDGQMNVYLVPRVFWQGGATYGDKVQLISYLDRNYTSAEPWSYFTHEGTHALAQDLIEQKAEGGGPDGVLVEGLAVWATGGHYRQEPIDAWAAVIAASSDYIPLADLRAGPFYDFQHEISYLEAGSFVKYLIERYGLDSFKELYGLATGDPTHDDELVQQLYGRSYAQLESDWLEKLSRLSPSPEQAEAWQLEIRSFDLMRRYETELDPDARILPAKPPTEWTTDTLQIFLHRSGEPANVALETALIASQDQLQSGDLDDASALLDDVEAALDSSEGLDRPSLQSRLAILELLHEQDRAILLADASGYLDTVTSTYAAGPSIETTLQLPFTSYDQEVMRLDVADDGLTAEGVVMVHAAVAAGSFADDGQLYAVTFTHAPEGWLMSSRQPTELVLSPLPAGGG
jgi:hypothetical protein